MAWPAQPQPDISPQAVCGMQKVGPTTLSSFVLCDCAVDAGRSDDHRADATVLPQLQPQGRHLEPQVRHSLLPQPWSPARCLLPPLADPAHCFSHRTILYILQRTGAQTLLALQVVCLLGRHPARCGAACTGSVAGGSGVCQCCKLAKCSSTCVLREALCVSLCIPAGGPQMEHFDFYFKVGMTLIC